MPSHLRVLTLALGLLCAASGFAQSASASKPGTAAPMAKADTMTKTDTMAKPAMAMAPGGGAGKVWVNSGSKRFHCEGTKFYGKTKEGEYMGEADAKARGYKGKACNK